MFVLIFMTLLCYIHDFSGSHQHGVLLSDTRGQAHTEDCVWEAPGERTTGETLYNCIIQVSEQQVRLSITVLYG